MRCADGITLDEARQRLTLSVPEAANLIGASKAWTYAAVERGELPSKIMRGRRFVLAGPLLKAFGLDEGGQS